MQTTVIGIHMICCHFSQDPYPDSGSAGSGVLSCIPATLTRWTEEARVLDGESVHDCVTGSFSVQFVMSRINTLIMPN